MALGSSFAAGPGVGERAAESPTLCIHLATNYAHLVAQAAAQRNGVLPAQVSKATHGHDICSADPWVFGFTFAGSPLQYGPLAHHPTQQAMQVAANTVLAVLDIPR